jgi:two-component system alkaline phosphatase synthesis response regulator PhoP
MVTAKVEESDAVLGLGVGADDYVRKPFSTRELIARVRAVLRRGEQGAIEVAGGRIVVGDLVIDPARHQVVVGGEEVAFTVTEFKLLHTLASSPGRAFRREELLDRVMGDDVFLIDRNIDVHVLAVRRKLGEHRGLVETVRGVGYRFRHPGEGK